VENGQLIVSDFPDLPRPGTPGTAHRNILRTPGVQVAWRVLTAGALLLAFAVGCVVAALDPHSVGLIDNNENLLVRPFLSLALSVAAAVAGLVGILVVRTGIGRPFHELWWVLRDRTTWRMTSRPRPFASPRLAQREVQHD
jgi:hypothetical protein